MRRAFAQRMRVAVLAGLLSCVLPGTAFAQLYTSSANVPRLGSVEVGGGVVWARGWDLASSNADLTRNAGTGTGPFTLFEVEGTVKPAVGVAGNVAFYLTRDIALEGGFQYSRPVVSVRVTNDAEAAADVTADETLSRYVVSGSFVYHLAGIAFANGRGVPFLLGGAGYLRELHEGRELVETGTQYHAGAGLKFWFGSGRRRLGVRGEFGVAMRDGAFDGDNETRRTLPTAGASVIYLF